MEGQYLVRKKFGGKAHLWTGADTRCRMASTGGLLLRKYQVVAHTHGRTICHMCSTLATADARKALHRSENCGQV